MMVDIYLVNSNTCDRERAIKGENINKTKTFDIAKQI